MLPNGLVLKYQNEPAVVCSEYTGEVSFDATASDTLIFYAEGSGVVTVNNRKYEISNSSLMLLPKATEISCALTNFKQRGRLVAVILTEEIIWDYESHFDGKIRSIVALLTQFHKIDMEYVGQFFVSLVAYSQQRLSITEGILRSRIFEILFAIENIILPEKVNVKESVSGHHGVRSIAHSISVDLSSRKPISEIARNFGVSPSTLKRWFKKGLDVSLNQWLIIRRLEKAKFLIRRGKSIKEASFECGFCSSSYMIKMYRKRYGCTPKEDMSKTNCVTF
ncbi:MAG TPA: AraC family transcriptional regulator [Cyclobacteriaceae bacterium]|jgi:AraC-like DNA-binding protein|nr:AraC family transcriptional regulator [Cyclobacteriaceae bacterium]